MEQTDLTNRELLTVPQVARRSGVSAKKLRQAIKSGALVAYTCGTGWPRIYWPEFLQWVRSTRLPSAERAKAGLRPERRQKP